METKKFAEENVGKFFMYGGERFRLVGATKDAVNPCLVIETRNVWLAKFGRLAQMWDVIIHLTETEVECV